MAAVMTTTNCPAATWTLIYTASGAVTVSIQNQDAISDVLIRIGTGVATSDSVAPPAAADYLRPFDWRSYTLATGEKILACPVSTLQTPANVNVRG